MADKAEMMDWRGCQVVDQDGDKVGKLDEIYLDSQTGEPEWAVVNTGLFGRKSSFVPLKDALREEDMIRVPYQAEQIKEAPSVDPDGQISPEEEQQVYAHYGLDYSRSESGSGLPEGGTATGAGERAGTASETSSGTASETSSGTASETSSGTASASAGETQSPDSGLRLQRMIREDVRMGDDGEVVERRSVEEERLSSDESDQR
jgi:sporulation protein YlmC with PRC-barrel domain